MCFEFCRNTPIGFSNINKESFNKYDDAMDYIQNRRSEMDTLRAAKYMLNKHLALTFKTCPQKTMNAVMQTVQKYNETMRKKGHA